MATPTKATRPKASPEFSEREAKLDITQWEADNPGRVVEVPDEKEGSKPVRDEDDIDPLAERAPKISPPTIGERVKGLRERARSLPVKKVASPAKNLTKPRVPVNSLVGRLWGIVGGIASSFNGPVGKVISVQAPVAGELLDDAIKGSVVDRVLQPVARASAGGEVLYALAGPPLLVLLMQTQPERVKQLLPLLKDSLHTWIRIAGPHIEKLAKEKAEFEEKYGADINMMIAYFFDVKPEDMEEFLQQMGGDVTP